MYHLEGLHPHERLPVAAVQVGGYVAVIDALHIHVEHSEGRPRIAFVARGGVELGRVARYGDDAAVHAADVAPRLRGVRLLRLAGQLAYICDAAGLVVVIGHKVFGLRGVVGRLRAARAGELDRGRRGLPSAGTGELLAVKVHVCGVRGPIHLKARIEPVGLPLHLLHVFVNLGLQPFGVAVAGSHAHEGGQQQNNKYGFAFHHHAFLL